MQVLFGVVLIIIAFVFGLILEPRVASNYSEQLNSARDAMGLCGGTTPCEPYATAEPAAEPPAEPAPPAEASPASAPSP